MLSPMGILNHYDTDRHIIFPTVDRFAKNRHWGGGIAAHGKATASFDIGDENHTRFSIEPELTCDYVNLWEESYREDGANSLNLAMPAKHTAYLSPTALLNFSLPLYHSNTWRSHLLAGSGYTGTYILSPYTTSAHLSNTISCQPNFTTTSYSTRFHQVTGRAQLHLENRRGSSMNLAYEVTAGNSALNHSLQLRAEWLL